MGGIQKEDNLGCLLYDKKYSIEGANQVLNEKKKKSSIDKKVELIKELKLLNEDIKRLIK